MQNVTLRCSQAHNYLNYDRQTIEKDEVGTGSIELFAGENVNVFYAKVECQPDDVVFSQVSSDVRHQRKVFHKTTTLHTKIRDYRWKIASNSFTGKVNKRDFSALQCSIDWWEPNGPPVQYDNILAALLVILTQHTVTWSLEGCRLLICNKRTYYTIEINKIMAMQMNKKKEQEHSIIHK